MGSEGLRIAELGEQRVEDCRVGGARGGMGGEDCGVGGGGARGGGLWSGESKE